MTNTIDAEKVRSIFLSDVHLGTRGCQAGLLLDFLRHHDCDHMYLVGDIIDGWRLKAKWSWPKAHDAVVAHVLSRAQAGVKVTYVPGNHDDFLRRSHSPQFAGIMVQNRAIHTTINGERYLIIHGDQFDVISTRARWLSLLGDVAYRAMLAANMRINETLSRLGLPYWSFSAWAKHHVKKVVNFISDYEANVAAEAERLKLRGIICGHIHHAAMRDNEGIRYINTGDWVESCTAVVEHFDGRFEIVRWGEIRRGQARAEAQPRFSLRRVGRLVARGCTQPYKSMRRRGDAHHEAAKQRRL